MIHQEELKTQRAGLLQNSSAGYYARFLRSNRLIPRTGKFHITCNLLRIPMLLLTIAVTSAIECRVPWHSQRVPFLKNDGTQMALTKNL
mmetsp:Transcript_31906/g.42134  ORF Transcript_31906/g.42134 Transcript_31906/m.42134 type:complete len:89 (-) Transcript_31906:229-495(-)